MSKALLKVTVGFFGKIILPLENLDRNHCDAGKLKSWGQA